MKTGFLLLSLAVLSVAADARADDRFPVLEKMGKPAVTQMNDILFWQRGFEGMSEADLIKKMGKPETIEQLEPNTVSNKPMHNLIYAVSPYSTLGFTTHEGSVSAVALVLIP